MFLRIKNRIDRELSSYLDKADKKFSLRKISPVLSAAVKNFILRDGKRVRPLLFITGFRGFAKKDPPGLFRASLSIELLHDFMLIHDDIIDKSDTRRGKPSMHKLLNNHLAGYPNIKFNGTDLAIVVGDIVYGMAIDAFLSVKADPRRKEAALAKLINATISTGSGEFIELIYGLDNIEKATQENIYRVYDFKTAYYTFAAPLCMGAQLGGAEKKQADALFKFGLCLGRAFQIKDDLLGMFDSERRTGKSNLSDLREAKKTILIWHAYNNSNSKNRAEIKKLLNKTNAGLNDLLKMRQLMQLAGTKEYCEKEINRLMLKAGRLIKASGIRNSHASFLKQYSQKLLKS